MEYKDLEKVNNEVRTIDVKGKGYVEVNERIKAFRKLFPMGTIETEMISNENGICVFKAIVSGAITTEGERLVLGVGHAYEKEGSTFINKTSYIENCETSAVGRALGMAGIGIDTSIASAEEVQNAIINQEKEKMISTAQISEFNDLILKYDKDIEEVFKYFKVKDTRELTKKQFDEFKAICEKGA